MGPPFTGTRASKGEGAGEEWDVAGMCLGRVRGMRGGCSGDEWFALPHYERVGALSDGWQMDFGIDSFTAKILGEGIREPPQNPEWGKPCPGGEIPVIPQTPEEKEFGNKDTEKGLRSGARAWEYISRNQVTLLKEDRYGIASSFVRWEVFKKDE